MPPTGLIQHYDSHCKNTFPLIIQEHQFRFTLKIFPNGESIDLQVLLKPEYNDDYVKQWIPM